MKILPGDLDDPRVRSLLEHHLATARAATAPGSDHALDVECLKAPDISFWTAWDGEVLLGTGALKRTSSLRARSIAASDSSNAPRSASTRVIPTACSCLSISEALDEGDERRS